MLAPKELTKVLNEFVIGQNRAKQVFSVGVYNQYKRVCRTQDIKGDDTEIAKIKHTIIGPTGSGKILLAQTSAKF